MGEYGPLTRQVAALIARATHLTADEAGDLYRAHGVRIVAIGPEAQRSALREARRTASAYHRVAEYERARRDAALAFRAALPASQGPWLLVSQAITNGAGAIVVADVLERHALLTLLGPWRQAVGDDPVPVGPGPNPARLATSRRA